MVVFTRKFGTLDPHLPIVWDKVPKKRFFLDTFPKKFKQYTPHHTIMDGHHGHLGHLVGLGGHLSWSNPISLNSIHVTGEEIRINYYIFSLDYK